MIGETIAGLGLWTGIIGNLEFMDVFSVLKAYPAVTMTLIMTLIPLLFLGSFNLIVINISQTQDSAAIKGLIYHLPTEDSLFNRVQDLA